MNSLNNPVLFAVDIALLLNDASTRKAIEISKGSAKNNNSELILGKNVMPHISLLMGGLNAGNLEVVRKKIKIIAAQTKILDLNVENLKNPGITWEWKIEASLALTMLYNRVVTECWKNMVYPVSKEMFYGKEINNKTPAWVNAFRNQERINRFSPHVTLSLNQVAHESSFQIKAVSLALFQLGNYCTCAHELVKFKLKGMSQE